MRELTGGAGKAWRFALLFCVTASTTAAAVELRQIRFKTGTAGLTAAPLGIGNATGEPIACAAELAHWYSAEAGTVAPGRQLAVPLWRNAASGETVLMNIKNEQMPVERLWCGYAGRAYETRALIRISGADVTCSGDGLKLICE